MSIKIKKGDKVAVMAGKDKGKNGDVTRVLVKENKVVVSGINIAKKAFKPTKKNPKGGIMEIAKPLTTSNVMLICSNCSKPSRFGISKSKDNKRIRTCKRCGSVVKE